MNRHSLSRSEAIDLYCFYHDLFRPLKSLCQEKEFWQIVEAQEYAATPFTVPINIFSDIPLEGPTQLLYKEDLICELDAVSFIPDREKAALLLFGTNSLEHPGVKLFKELPKYFIGGSFKNLKCPRLDINHFLKPKKNLDQWRSTHKIKKLAGFHTRNPPHLGHEFIHRQALKKADGVLLSPILGIKKTGDFSDQAIISGYQTYLGLVENSEKYFLFPVPLNARYMGPREAVLQTLIRKNLGCELMIIGRDHAGVGDYYGRYESAEKVCSLEKDLNIEVIAVKEPFYCHECEHVTNQLYCSHPSGARQQISGTRIRSLIESGQAPPFEIFRKDIYNSILKLEKVFT